MCGGQRVSTLTPKQKAFIAEYLKDFNATRAARDAGYKGSDETLAAVGSENLRKPKIANIIQRELADRTMLPEEALLRLSDMARADIGDFLRIDEYDGRIISIDFERARREGKLHLVKKYQAPGKAHGASIELHDSKDALKTLLTVYGRLGVKVQVDWRVEIVQYLREGKLTQEEVIAELGNELANEFFTAAGLVPSEIGKAAEEG